MADNISPGLAWPPKQTTICVLGPSATAPLASALTLFRDEFEYYIEHGRSTVAASAANGVRVAEAAHV